MAEAGEEGNYSPKETGRLELIWGAGFLSPGGPAEVARTLGGHRVDGCSVLDIGSGAGGVGIALVRNHDAALVVGVDVQQELVGVVLSKDAIIHVHDKRALYAEAFRVLRPGGRLLVGDWLRGDDPSLTPQVAAFVVAAGHGFAMVSREEVVAIVESVGFGEVESEDRGSWYTAEAQAELERLRGEMRAEFVDRWGEAAAQAELDFWEVLVTSLEGGALNPAHVRARKPMQT